MAIIQILAHLVMPKIEHQEYGQIWVAY